MDAELVGVSKQKTGVMKTALEGSQLAVCPMDQRGQLSSRVAAGFQEGREGKGWMVGQSSR